MKAYKREKTRQSRKYGGGNISCFDEYEVGSGQDDADLVEVEDKRPVTGSFSF